MASKFTNSTFNSRVAAMMASAPQEEGNAVSEPAKGSWTIGLINSSYKYLTAETFGFKINANGKVMKKKQIWIMEPNGDSICLRSHLHKYLAVDKFGNINCEKEEKDETTKFDISVSEDFSGRWSFKSVSRGYYLGASPDALVCSAQNPGESELWSVNLDARPQVNLGSIGRKRFARLSDDETEIQADENVAWGSDALFTLEFRHEANKYAIHSSNNMYLKNNGSLVAEIEKDCLFACEYHRGYIALRDQSGLYLSTVGSKATLKTKSNVANKDELFSLEDSLPQISLQAVSNKKFVSIKQGIDVSANQGEVSDHETFQLEYDHPTSKWIIRTMQDKYFNLQGGGIQAGETKKSDAALLELVWQDDGTLAFKADSGKYVGTNKMGHLFANGDTIAERTKFYFYLINRPILVLRCEQGFVGYKDVGETTKLECNKSSYSTIQVERADEGQVYFKGQNGKYWQIKSGGIQSDSDVPHGFYLELREPTKMCIKTIGGEYITEQRNGGFTVGGRDQATRWEF